MLEILARAKDGEGVKSGPLGLAIILVMCVACYFLFKSMSKHMKRVREEFPTDLPRESADAHGDSTDAATAADPVAAHGEPVVDLGKAPPQAP